MAMKRCPVCGERYSDTYRDCPFCEEEAAYQDGEEIRRNVWKGGRRAAGRQKMSLLTPVLIVLIIIMASLLVYLLWGDKMFDKNKETPVAPPTTEVAPGNTIAPVKPEEEPEKKPAVVEPCTQPGEAEKPDDEPTAEIPAQTEYDKVNNLPNGLVVSNSDFTLSLLGETHTVRVSGGSGTYKWVSEDEGIASVDANGKITAVSGGTVNVLVTDGSKKGVVIVRVKATGSLPEAPVTNTETTPSGGSHKLNREDITLKVGESFQLKADGVMNSPVWNSSKSSVVSVNGSGVVKGVAPGTSTVTVSWDGGSLSCIVRVK